MDFIKNFPFFSIVLTMVCSIITSALKGKAAKWLNTCVIGIVSFFSICTLYYTYTTNSSYVYQMGPFGAPWGNELRTGVLEASMALFFCIIMYLSLVAGRKYMEREVEESKHHLYYILTNLLLSSLLALIYTNDMFTAYVFVEINTIAACGLIMIRQNGRTIEAATRYMIMSLLGSGLLLIGLCLIYDFTGHLLMSNIKEEIAIIVAEGQYTVPLIVAIALMAVGLAIKSALYPFHSWLPDAYGYSTISSAAMLSSLVSKGYIFLLIKIFYRVIGFEIICNSKIINVMFVFGLAGMIMGSISAMKENDIRRMISFSSVAQIGYIYMGFGLGTTEGMIASVFHIVAHAATKSLLFVSAIGLTDVSKMSRKFQDLTGAAYRNKEAGLAFTVGCLSMVGIPGFCGFISKLLFAQSAVMTPNKMLPTLVVLAISTIFNAIYFMKTVIRIYTPVRGDLEIRKIFAEKGYSVALLCFVILNIVVGMCSQPIVDLIAKGLQMFS